MSDLPASWANTDLGSVCDVIRGITFPASAKEGSPSRDNVCCLRTTNVQREVDWSNVYFVPRAFVKRGDQLVRLGDILMSMANSYELVGKVAVVRSLPYHTAFGAFVAAVRPQTSIYGQYLFHLLRTERVQAALREGSSQTVNIANISISKLAAVDVPLAPLNEQKRIADKLDAMLARVDACRERLDRVPDVLKRFLQSVFASATSGVRSGEWRETALEELVEILDSRRVPVNARERDARNAGKGADELFPYYGATGPVGHIAGFLFDEPLILLGEDGAPFLDPLRPKAYQVSGKCWVNNHAHVLRARADVADGRYLTAFLNAFDYAGRVTGTTRLKLTQAAMRSIPVPVPPLGEQQRIADHLERIGVFAHSLEARRIAAHTLVEHLTPALLAKAFRSELVPQDPNDEPASAVLEHLRTLRAIDVPSGRQHRGAGAVLGARRARRAAVS